MKLLVFGLGRSGLATCRLLAKQGHSFEAYDDRPKAPQLAELNSLGGVFTSTPQSSNSELCIAAPGIALDHPDLQQITKRMPVIGEVEWVYRTVAADLIGVTGTAGKTSVTRWLCDSFCLAGLDAAAGGNIDPALADVALEHQLLVCELSSFQLERCPSLKPRIAIILNLGQDHLDRHGSLKAYHEAKKAIIRNQDSSDVFIYNADDAQLCQWASESPANCLGFSLQKPADAYLADGQLMLGDTAILDSSSLQVRGKQQVANALAVALAAKAYGLSQENLQAGLKAFKGVAGRYSLAAKLGKISFIEDSIATRSLAVKAALESSEAPIVWIAGGADKGADFEALNELIKTRVSLFIGMGSSGKSFASKAARFTQTAICEQAEGKEALLCATKLAIKHLQTQHQGQGTVLLAPLAASFDQFNDYKDRALKFREVLREIEQLWTPY